MTSHQLRQHIVAVPFLPFHVRTIDGCRVPVANRNFILINPPQTHVFVFQPDSAFQVLDINLVGGVEKDAPPPRTASEFTDTNA